LGDVARICALAPVIEPVVVELESIDEVSRPEESVDSRTVIPFQLTYVTLDAMKTVVNDRVPLFIGR
jgi:hypothetical protein